MDFALNIPINPVSFGQVSLAILREIYRRGLAPSLLPIGNVNTSSCEDDPQFLEWINKCISKYKESHVRDIPVITRIFNKVGILQ